MLDNILIDAATIKSGGGLTHLRSFLSHSEPSLHRFNSLIVVVDSRILPLLPTHAWIHYICVPKIFANSFLIIIWRHFILPRLYCLFSCSITLAFCGYTTTLLPITVGFVQNLLPFDLYESRRYGFTISRLRYFLLRYLTLRFMSQSSGSIYFSRYSLNVLSRIKPSLYQQKHAIVYHGVDNSFFTISNPSLDSYRPDHLPTILNFVYVSTLSPYKNHRFLIDSVLLLREKSGLDIRLHVVGGSVKRKLSKDPKLSLHDWVVLDESLDWDQLKILYSSSDFLYGLLLAKLLELFNLRQWRQDCP